MEEFILAKKIILGSVDLKHVPKDFAWYTIVTRFNYEEAYIQNVKESIMGTDLEQLVKEFYVPIKYIKEIVSRIDGTKRERIKKVKGSYSNYVFIKCKMTGNLWDRLRTTTGAAVILSMGGIPVPITDEEIETIRNAQCMEGFSTEEIVEKEKELREKYIMQ